MFLTVSFPFSDHQLIVSPGLCAAGWIWPKTEEDLLKKAAASQAVSQLLFIPSGLIILLVKLWAWTCDCAFHFSISGGGTSSSFLHGRARNTGLRIQPRCGAARMDLLCTCWRTTRCWSRDWAIFKPEGPRWVQALHKRKDSPPRGFSNLEVWWRELGKVFYPKRGWKSTLKYSWSVFTNPLMTKSSSSYDWPKIVYCLGF